MISNKGVTDIQTDTDGRMDRASYRDARTHLKKKTLDSSYAPTIQIMVRLFALNFM